MLLPFCFFGNYTVGSIFTTIKLTNDMDTIVFGAGCFWCVEAIFQQVEGVVEVGPGYCGGSTLNPTYEEVCAGTTGHVEVARVLFDSSIVSFTHLLEVFWRTHDPTTINRQGNDVGTQYRSSIFCTNKKQFATSLEYKKKLDDADLWIKPIVTEVKMLGEYYPAEDYHYNYYNKNSNQSYCKYIIQPKLEKYNNVFGVKKTIND
mgnify:CR=1 FL=1